MDSAAVAGVGGDAGACADADFEAFADVEYGGGEVGVDGVGHAQGRFARGFGHEDDEFVAAVAEAEVRGAAEGEDAFADLPEEFAADEVAVDVVDAFEAVEVEEDETEGFGVAAGVFKFALEFSVEVAAVVEAGDVVGDGELLCAGDVLCVFNGDCGVVGEDVEEGDRVFRLIVELGVEDFEDAVGAFATTDGEANSGPDGDWMVVGEAGEAGVFGGLGDDEGFAALCDPASEAFADFDAEVFEARVGATVGGGVVEVLALGVEDEQGPEFSLDELVHVFHDDFENGFAVEVGREGACQLVKYQKVIERTP